MTIGDARDEAEAMSAALVSVLARRGLHVICPAELTFKRDRTLSPSARRVYDFLSTELDFWEVLERKAYAIAEQANIDRGSTLRALGELIGKGYLVEHGRNENGVYQLTRAWSVEPDRKTSTHPAG